MTMRAMFLVLILAGAAMAAEQASSGRTVKKITLPEVKVALKPGPGMDKTAAYCGVCHSLDYITTQPKLSKEKWGAEVNKMIKVMGAPIPPDAAREISAYLGAEYGE